MWVLAPWSRGVTARRAEFPSGKPPGRADPRGHPCASDLSSRRSLRLRPARPVTLACSRGGPREARQSSWTAHTRPCVPNAYFTACRPPDPEDPGAARLFPGTRSAFRDAQVVKATVRTAPPGKVSCLAAMGRGAGVRGTPGRLVRQWGGARAGSPYASTRSSSSTCHGGGGACRPDNRGALSTQSGAPAA